MRKLLFNSNNSTSDMVFDIAENVDSLTEKYNELANKVNNIL